MIKLVTVVAVLFLSGCGFNGNGANGQAHSDAIWSNADSTKHNLSEDRYTCMQNAAKAVPPKQGVTWNALLVPYSYDMNSDSRDKLFTACMNAKGWVENSKAAKSNDDATSGNEP